MPPRFVARQLSHPSGWLGHLFGRLMNRHNARLNAFALEQLALTQHDRVLEVGFGGGAALEQMMSRARFVCGLDRSETAVQGAENRFADQVAVGCADFRVGRVEAMPFDAGDFDWVYTVNTIYFWPSLEAGFVQVHRVLKPLGQVVVGFLPKEHMDRMGMPADIFTTRTIQEVMTALDRVGFHRIEIRRPTPETLGAVVVAVRR